MARNLEVIDSRLLAKRHRKLTFRQADDPSAPPAPAIAFNVDLSKTVSGVDSQVAFRLNKNRWKGRESVQMIVEEMAR